MLCVTHLHETSNVVRDRLETFPIRVVVNVKDTLLRGELIPILLHTLHTLTN